MKVTFIWPLVLTIALGVFGATRVEGGIVTFDFVNGEEFDNDAPAGTTMMRDAGGTEDPITITSVDAGAPEYVDDGGGGLMWDGVSYLSTGTDIHTSGGMRIFNPGSFPSSGAGSDGTGFNEGEYWVMKFNRPVVVDLIDFNSLSQGSEIGRLTLDSMTPIDFDYDTLGTGSANTFNDPFGGAVIPAGTNIKFEGVAGDWRLIQIQVEEVPEPSVLALLLLGGLGFNFVKWWG